MKKLLVLALVLSMATMASAALQITVNGVIGNNAVTLNPSETAELGLYASEPIGFGLNDWAGAALVCNTQLGAMSGGVSLQPNEPGIAIFQDAAIDLGFVVPTYPAENGLGFTFSITGANIPVGQIINQIIFHCNAPGTTVLTLWGSQDYVEFTNLGSVTITQVPEPITMTLLGLGGLFLRRRSK